MKVSIIAFTDNGMNLANKLANNLDNESISVNEINLTRCEKGGLSTWTEEHFSTSDALVFIGALGIAVRAVSPFIKTKVNDPAVVVVDELGRFSIPVLSGHIGGANELAIQISKVLDCVPVITTATDINNLFAVDTWAKSQGLRILNPENIKLVSSKLLEGKTVNIKSDYPIKEDLPKNIQLNSSDTDYDVIISHKNHDYDKEWNALFLIPPIITAGIGCRRGVDFEIIENSVLNALNKENCHILSLSSIASIDKKANEKGILEFAEKYALPFITFSADELNSLEGDFTKSDFVKSVVEVDNVCERSAVYKSRGKLLRKKDAGHGVTVALAIKDPELSW